MRVSELGLTEQTNTQLYGRREEQRFRILVTYAAVGEERVDDLIHRAPVVVPEGGSLAINASHLNVTSLAAAAATTLAIRLRHPPRYGWLAFKVGLGALPPPGFVFP